MTVSPPGRFSTTTGWRQSSLIRCPITRARMSVGPPAGNGTMMRTGRSGKLFARSGPWANAPPVTRGSSSHRATSRCLSVIKTPAKVVGTAGPPKHRRRRMREPQPQLFLAVGGARDVRDRNAVVDGLAADHLGVCLLLGGLQHL